MYYPRNCIYQHENAPAKWKKKEKGKSQGRQIS